MDTQNDGLQKVDSFEIWPFFVSMLDFRGFSSMLFQGGVGFNKSWPFAVPEVYGEDPLEPGEVDRVRQSRRGFSSVSGARFQGCWDQNALPEKKRLEGPKRMLWKR